MFCRSWSHVYVTALLLAFAFLPGVAEAKTHWSVSGTSILDPSGAPVRLHGFDVCWWVPPTDEDAANVQKIGANCVRYMFGYNPTGKYDRAQVNEVVRQIHCFTSRGIGVIPVLYMFQRPDPSSPGKKLDPWSTPEMNAEFFDLWSDLIGQLKDEPNIMAWEPINEPHDVAPAVAAAWYRALLPRLRQLDPDRPIVVEGANYSHAEDLTAEFKMDDPNIIYAFHFYYPYEFTSDIRKPPLEYPGAWGKSYLEKQIEPAIQFRDKFHIPVWCGEWGTKTAGPGYRLWQRDVFDILEANHFDWCIWAWALQPAHPQNDDFDINPQKKDSYQLMIDLFRRFRPDPSPTSAP
jgi:Cellulase (glycosyl hydrolase family 5)